MNDIEAIKILKDVKNEHKDNQVYVDLIDYLVDELETEEYSHPYGVIEDFYNELNLSGIAPNIGAYFNEYDEYFQKNMDDVFEIFNDNQNELPDYIDFRKFNWSAFELVKTAIAFCLQSFDYLLEED